MKISREITYCLFCCKYFFQIPKTDIDAFERGRGEERGREIRCARLSLTCLRAFLSKGAMILSHVSPEIPSEVPYMVETQSLPNVIERMKGTRVK